MILRADNPVLAAAVTVHPKMVKSPLELQCDHCYERIESAYGEEE